MRRICYIYYYTYYFRLLSSIPCVYWIFIKITSSHNTIFNNFLFFFPFTYIVNFISTHKIPIIIQQLLHKFFFQMRYMLLFHIINGRKTMFIFTTPISINMKKFQTYWTKIICIMHPANNAVTSPNPVPIHAPLTWNI